VDDFEINWFANLIKKKLGRGDKIGFWNDFWMGDCDKVKEIWKTIFSSFCEIGSPILKFDNFGPPIRYFV